MARFPFALAAVLSLAAGARAQNPLEPTPRADPRAGAPIGGPAAPEAPGELIPDEPTLRRLAEEDIASARPILRRAARSAPTASTRSYALRLLGSYDTSSATTRICARALRVDVDPLVRRAGAECLGRAGPELCGAQTPALVAALGDDNLDVLTMAGWALANGGDASGYAAVARTAAHEDPRVAVLFLGYADRMRARLGLDFVAEPASNEERDAAGNRLVPPGIALTTNTNGLNVAAATAWLGLYGGMQGWFHGTFLLSAQGGAGGAEAAPLAGLGLAALGASGGVAYAFFRADDVVLAHTIVQLGTAGTAVGYGAGLLTGAPPDSSVAAADLSLLGALGGTALGVALVESDEPPSIGALGLGALAGMTTALAAGGLARAYIPSSGASFGYALVAGGLAMSGGTLAAQHLDVGLFPLAGGTLGALVGGGTGAVVALALEGANYTSTTGWLIATGTIGGTVAGALGGMFLPRALDPLRNAELVPGVKLQPPSWAFLDDGRGHALPAMVTAGSFTLPAL